MLSKKRDAAVRARSEERVDALLEHKTERETLELLASSGVTLSVLVATAVSETPLETFDSRDVGADWDPDPDVLARVVRRIELRLERQLPHAECIVDEVNREPEASHCACLSETLDGSAETLTRAGVVKVARQAHKERWDFLKRKPKSRPRPPTPQPRQLSDRASKPSPVAAAPNRELVTETRTRPFRVVKRTPKWFEPLSQSIIDRQF